MRGSSGHDGATVGQNAFLRIDRKSGTIAALFANGGSANDFYLDVFREAFDKAVACPTPEIPEVLTSPPDDLERYAGTYRNVVGDINVDVGDEGLARSSTLRIDDLLIKEPGAAMHYIGDDDFIWRNATQVYPATMSFRKFADDGQPQSLFTGLRWYHRVK